MARFKCSFCKYEQEVSFFEPWFCPDCSDLSIEMVDCSEEELAKVFEFVLTTRKSLDIDLSDHVLILSYELQPQHKKEATKIIDMLLLFFNRVIVPDINVDDLNSILGNSKAKAYRDNGLISCADNSFYLVNFRGLSVIAQTSLPTDQFDFELATLPSLTPDTNKAEKLVNFLYVLRNLEYLYVANFYKSIRNIIATGNGKLGKFQQSSFPMDFKEFFFPANEPPMLVRMPRFLRNEMFCTMTGANFLTDRFYGIVYDLRNTAHHAPVHEYTNEFAGFYQWIKTTKFKIAELNWQDVLRFRETHNSLAPQLRRYTQKHDRCASSKHKQNTLGSICNRMEDIVSYYDRILSKKHEAQKDYFIGLMSFFGSVIGDDLGAILGGIGGAMLGNKLLEYERNIVPPISFIMDKIIDK